MALGHSRPRICLGVIALDHELCVGMIFFENLNAIFRDHARLRIASSSVTDLCPEPTGLMPKRRRKPRIAKHHAGRKFLRHDLIRNWKTTFRDRASARKVRGF
jgi:hypothetical protein